MIKVEYTLVKWKEEGYRELPIKIQEEAVGDFCEMMDWDEEEFANNTIRRPIEVEEELDPENEEYATESSKKKITDLVPKAKTPVKDIDWKEKPKKRKRRTKEEMIAAGEQSTEERVRKPRTNLLFSEEVNDFIKKNYEENRDMELIEMIEEEFGQTFTYDQIKAHRRQIGCVKSRGNQSTKEKKKIGKPKKYTDEVLKYLKDNINNFSNKELCEELSNQFNVKVTPDVLAQTMSNKGIRRDEVLPEGFNKEIIDFVMKSKKTDAYVLRDNIIEKFEKDVKVTKLRELMKKRNLPGEEISDEVKRITQQREEPEELEEINDIEDIL